MAILFHCEHCHKEVKAPDEAGGQRGKCPFCGGSNYIPSAEAKDGIFDLAPLDEQDEKQRRQEVDRLLQAEKAILADTSRGGGANEQPRLSQREPSQVKSEDVQHLVVNFVLDMSNGQLERADTHVMKLNQFPAAGRQAVRDFLEGRALEPALDPIPTKIREGFLKNLLTRLR